MLENARREVILLLVLSLLSVFFIATRDFILGPDLKGGSQLIYEVNWDRMLAEGLVKKDADAEQVMTDTVRILQERIDPRGTTEAHVTRRGKHGILVELPQINDDAERDAVERRISTLGKLEMRIVANEEYNQHNVKFELAKEKERLDAWLKEADHRAIVQKDPLKILLYNNLVGDKGPLTQALKWAPHRIKAKKQRAKDGSSTLVWDRAESSDPSSFAVAAFTTEMGTPPTKESDVLIEYLPINHDEVYFEGGQMDPAGVGSTIDHRTGGNAVQYQFKSEYIDSYAEWSDKYTNKRSAIILNGYVESAPTFQGRIPGHGIITGSFSPQEQKSLENVLKTGSLQVIPELQSRLTIGASLGEVALWRGFWSILAGAVLVVVFMFWYYRLSGLVANVALALNLFLMIGVMQFIRATYTLPGLAGIVLTLGMAVDANILIYERIREELARGKATLQAIRAGFDRALVTIIDCHVTAFIAGVVLYNVGVGPIRGFAVTLNVGIITTVFTAFFTSRLIFHALLISGRLKEIRMKAMFTNVHVDWLGAVKYAIPVSGTIIVLGMINFLWLVPKDVSMGLDFTGGAAMEVRLEHSMRTTELVAKLKADEKFHRDFPHPQVQTAEKTDAAGVAKTFAIKIKLGQKQRDRLEKEQSQAVAAGAKHEPFFVTELKRVLAQDLVKEASSAPVISELPSNVKTAMLDVRFTSKVKVDEVKRVLSTEADQLPNVDVRLPLGSTEPPEGAQTVRVEFDVEATTRPEDVLPMVKKSLGTRLKDAEGKAATMSNPIPQAEQIGGRMVTELRNAAIGSIILALFLCGMYIRIRFHEYKYGIAAAVAILHDLLVSFGMVVFANAMGWVNVELDLGMIAAFLTVVGYSINDTIVVFDRFRENLSDQKRLGDTKESFRDVLNRSINQTMSRTVWTSATVLFVIIAQFLVNYGVGSTLEGFSFCMFVGVVSGVYSTIYIATPIVLWLHNHEQRSKGSGGALVAANAPGLAPSRA